MSDFFWSPDDAPDDRALRATKSFDLQNPHIQKVIREVTQPSQSDEEKAIALFNFVRDEIRYDPYRVGLDPALFVGSDPILAGHAYCVPKAITWVTLLRACGIPALLGFADVTNHLSSPKLLENLRSTIFAHHGYGVVWLHGRWIKATPTFNRTLCAKAGIRVLDFNGVDDAIFHPFDAAGHRHMEYLKDDGWRWDFDLQELDDAYREHSPHWYDGTVPALTAQGVDFEREVEDAART